MTSCSEWVDKLKEPRVPSETRVTQSFHFDDFRGISASKGIYVEYVPQTRQENVVVQGPENVFEALTVENHEGILYFDVTGPKDFRYTSDSQRMRIKVFQPGLHSFEALAGSSIVAADTLKLSQPVTVTTYSNGVVDLEAVQAPEVKMDAYTESIIRAAVEVENCEVSAFSGAEVTLYGEAVDLSLMASEAEIIAMDLEAQNAEAVAEERSLITSPIHFDSKKEVKSGKIITGYP